MCICRTYIRPKKLTCGDVQQAPELLLLVLLVAAVDGQREYRVFGRQACTCAATRKLLLPGEPCTQAVATYAHMHTCIVGRASQFRLPPGGGRGVAAAWVVAALVAVWCAAAGVTHSRAQACTQLQDKVGPPALPVVHCLRSVFLHSNNPTVQQKRAGLTSEAVVVACCRRLVSGSLES